YGRNSIDIADDRITEITAHARGVQYFYPKAHSVIDIGGQDSKAIIMSQKTGSVIDFQMNDKCAAGTGRFLEVMARALEVPIEDIGQMALKSTNPSAISSTCTVFAESEVISLFAKGTPKHDIASGIHKSIARRVAGMSKRIGVEPLLVFCGGVAKNVAVKKYLEEELGYDIFIPQYPQLTGAIGAAIIAQDKNKNK
ncbi:MAG: 2-hydroxyglutaryl-CoA dehydratase, partial [archaeon]|nr:2-hydroxyglutaryl-CoA dehydratase [archaeon]